VYRHRSATKKYSIRGLGEIQEIEHDCKGNIKRFKEPEIPFVVLVRCSNSDDVLLYSGGVLDR
jgi:hypothetical protein